MNEQKLIERIVSDINITLERYGLEIRFVQPQNQPKPHSDARPVDFVQASQSHPEPRKQSKFGRNLAAIMNRQ